MDHSKHIHNRHRDPTAVWLRVGPESPSFDPSAELPADTARGQSSSKSTEAVSEVDDADNED